MTAVAPRLAAEMAALRTAPLPDALRARAHALLLDFLGVAIGGASEASSVAVRDAVAALGGAGTAPVLGTAMRCAPAQAALANGAAAHALEMDDTHLGGSFHPGAAVFPAVLAAATLRPATTLDAALRAAVAGYEVSARLAMALGPARHYARGFHPTGTCGTFGAAVAAGLVLGLDVAALTHALGVAGSQAAGSMEFLADGSWTKRLHPGWAASAGLHAAALAAAGFRGPATILEGRFGVLHAMADGAEPGLLERHDGWELLHTGVKPHACCRYAQGPIDAALALRAAHDLRAADVAAVEVAIVSAGFPIVCEPLAAKRAPASVVDAQFSLPFAVAVALVRGHAGPDDFGPDAWDDPAVRAVMQVVTPRRDAALDAAYPRAWPTWLRVTTHDGRTLAERVVHPSGDPERFLTAEALRAKLHRLATRTLPDDAVVRLVATLDAADHRAPLLPLLVDAVAR